MYYNTLNLSEEQKRQLVKKASDQDKLILDTIMAWDLHKSPIITPRLIWWSIYPKIKLLTSVRRSVNTLYNLGAIVYGDNYSHVCLQEGFSTTEKRIIPNLKKEAQTIQLELFSEYIL